jgi:hypothetical protein
MEQDIEDTYDMLLDHKVTARQFFKTKRYRNLVACILGYLSEEDFIDLMFTNRQVHDLCVSMKELRQIILIKNKFVPYLLENGLERILLDASANNILLTLKCEFSIMQSFQTMIKQFFSRWINLHWFIKPGRTEVNMHMLKVVYKSLLLGVFKTSRDIKKITICNCQIDSYYFNELLDSIQGLPLEHLSLERNLLFSMKNVELFNTTMKYLKGLKYLNLISCGLDDEVVSEISEGFSYLESLEELYLNNNVFTLKSLDNLVNALKNLPKLSTLNLDGIKLSTGGSNVIGDYLASPECNLKILDISNSSMGNNGLKVILKSLKENDRLESISLRNIDTNEEGFALLTKSVPQLSTRCINYSDNIISEGVYGKLKKSIVGSNVKSIYMTSKKNIGIDISSYKFEDYSIIV